MTAEAHAELHDRARADDEPPAYAAPDWAERIERHVEDVEALLSGELQELITSWDLGTPDPGISYSAHLPMQLRELITRGGKRVRPIMTLIGWVAGDVGQQRRGYGDMMRASCAIEMLHCFALVHDDVMDESSTRRGRPTVHRRAARLHSAHRARGTSERFGESIAVLAGDLAHSEADRLAASLPAPMRRVWQQLVLELIAGQTWDVVGSAVADRRVEFARSVARQKTGYYTVARPLQLGAVAAHADAAALAALDAYGRHAGEAFALRDDILGAFGDPVTTGKPAGDDIRSGKPTVLLALAVAKLQGAAATALEAAGSPTMTDQQVTAVQDALHEYGIVAEVEALIDTRIADALAALDTGCLSPDGVAGLAYMVTDLVRRGR